MAARVSQGKSLVAFDLTVLKARHHGHVEKVAVTLLALTVVAETRAVLPTCASSAAVCQFTSCRCGMAQAEFKIKDMA